MKITDKLYTALCVLFTSLIILGNMVYQKFVGLDLPFHRFELSVGAILYPLTFLITDLIAEFYGKERAQFCINFAMFTNILIMLIISFMDYLSATEWSRVNDETFHNIFGYYSIAFIGSVVAFYIAQTIDLHIYIAIRNFTKGKYLWLGNLGSTSIALLVDTSVVISFMTFFGIFSSEHMWPLIVNSYSWKLLFTFCSIPLFYLCIVLMRSFFDFTRYKKVV
ncbi:MAG: queuosine precursor transporter [Alphaproteobacteria bacterium]|nr:queuosine precursor transporter [Alphaproteobacteria bacterium]